jgi:hypothetical protein
VVLEGACWILEQGREKYQHGQDEERRRVEDLWTRLRVFKRKLKG